MASIDGRCVIDPKHEFKARKRETSTNVALASVHIRLVRYAADCAARVIHLTGEGRPYATAAIQAARDFADDPTCERLQACINAADLAFTVSYMGSTLAIIHGDSAVRAVHSSAVLAAALAAKAAVFDDVTIFAARAAEAAAEAATGALHAGPAPGAEQAWQAERRKFYGLGP
jgi:hypothetical protein